MAPSKKASVCAMIRICSSLAPGSTPQMLPVLRPMRSSVASRRLKRDRAALVELVADEVGLVGRDGDGRGSGADGALGLGLRVARESHLDQNNGCAGIVRPPHGAAPVGRVVAPARRRQGVDHHGLPLHVAAQEVSRGAEAHPDDRRRDAVARGRRGLGDRENGFERRGPAVRRELRRPRGSGTTAASWRSPGAARPRGRALELGHDPVLGHAIISRARNAPPILVPFVAALAGDGGDLTHHGLDFQGIHVRIGFGAGRQRKTNVVLVRDVEILAVLGQAERAAENVRWVATGWQAPADSAPPRWAGPPGLEPEPAPDMRAQAARGCRCR